MQPHQPDLPTQLTYSGLGEGQSGQITYLPMVWLTSPSSKPLSHPCTGVPSVCKPLAAGGLDYRGAHCSDREIANLPFLLTRFLRPPYLTSLSPWKSGHVKKHRERQGQL